MASVARRPSTVRFQGIEPRMSAETHPKVKRGVNARRDYIVAIHEAAHAVVFHLLGVRVLYVTIQPNRRALGHVTPVRYKIPRYLEALIIGGFAGSWATKLFTDCRKGEFRHSSSDSRNINRNLRHIASDPFTRNVLRRMLKAESAAIVLANEKHIRTVADFLIENKHFGNWRYVNGNQEASEQLNRLVRRDPPPVCPQKKCLKSNDGVTHCI
jgi:hypothetical protein